VLRRIGLSSGECIVLDVFTHSLRDIGSKVHTSGYLSIYVVAI
jgi:hypothetical protein